MHHLDVGDYAYYCNEMYVSFLWLNSPIIYKVMFKITYSVISNEMSLFKSCFKCFYV